MAQYVASPPCQRTPYVVAGGQPGHRRAWFDPEGNRLTDNCVADTLPTLDEAYLRPRYPDYIPCQNRAGKVIHDYLRDGGNALGTLDDLERLFRESRASG
jgi:multiple sugar transport system substrate-binding protein